MWSRPGDEIIVEASAHIYIYEVTTTTSQNCEAVLIRARI
jgi:threonine aldolase